MRFLLLLLLPSYVFSQAPANDVPCGAISIPVVSGSACSNPAIYQWQNATFGYNSFSTPSCGGFSVNNSKDVWFSFVATGPNISIIFSQAYGISHNLAAAVYDAESCTFYYDLKGCDDDSGPDNYPQLSFYNFTPGQLYFLRVWQYNSAIDSGSAKICIVSEPVAPANAFTGVNTQFPSASLDVNGTLKMRGGTPGVNKVLTSDAAGNASWKAAQMPGQVYFGAYIFPTLAPLITCCSFTKLVFAEPEEAGTANLSNGTFTAPETAVYHFDANATFALTAASTNVSLRIAVLNSSGTLITNYEARENNSPASTEKTLSVSASIRLTAGQRVEVHFYANSSVQLSPTAVLGVDRKTRFQGYKVN